MLPLSVEFDCCLRINMLCNGLLCKFGPPVQSTLIESGGGGGGSPPVAQPVREPGDVL
jgi:hypothetical protein